MGLLSSGVWLTARRVRAIATISGVLGAAMIAFLALAGEGTLDPFGQPIGTDFSAFWHAGRIVNGGNPAAAWDPDTLNAAVRATHVGSDFATAWVYPPVFLLAAAPLAELPYLPALFLVPRIAFDPDRAWAWTECLPDFGTAWRRAAGANGRAAGPSRPVWCAGLQAAAGAAACPALAVHEKLERDRRIDPHGRDPCWDDRAAVGSRRLAGLHREQLRPAPVHGRGCGRAS